MLLNFAVTSVSPDVVIVNRHELLFECLNKSNRSVYISVILFRIELSSNSQYMDYRFYGAAKTILKKKINSTTYFNLRDDPQVPQQRMEDN